MNATNDRKDGVVDDSTRRQHVWTYLLLALLVGSLSGCAEYSYRLTELYGMQCRPEALQQGQCVTAKRAQP